MLGEKRWYWQHYGVAVGTVTVAMLLTQLLDPLINPTIFHVFYASVATSAWYGGLKAGLLASILSILGYFYFFIEPFGEMELASTGELFRISSFFFTSQLINFLGSSLRTAKLKIKENIQTIQKSEAQFNRLTQTNLIGIIVAHVDGTIIEANNAFLNMVGYAQEDVRAGRIRCKEMTPPEYLQVSETSLEELRKFGQCKPFEKEFVRKDGSRVPVLLGSAFLDDSQEKVISYVLDISDRRQIEAILKEKQELFEHFMNNSPARAYIKDATGRYIYVNQVIERLFNWKQDDWMGKTDFELVSQQVAQQYRDHDLRVLNTKQAIEIEEVIFINNEKRDLVSFKFPFENASGQQFLAGMSFDITEQKWNRFLLAIQTQILAMVATGTELSQTIETLLGSIEQLSENAICAVLLLNRDKTKLDKIIAPNLPSEYKNLIEQGIPVSDRSISCGRAVYYRKPIKVEDIANDPYWEIARDVFLERGLRASWSNPILNTRGEILGTIVMYYPTPREPNSLEYRLVDISIYLAGLAIDRQHSEEALAKSEARFRTLVEKVSVIPWEADGTTGKTLYIGPQAEKILGYPSQMWYAEKFWSEHIHPSDREWVTRICLEKAKTLNNYEMEYRIVAADGRIVWVYDLISVVREKGQPNLLRGFMVDITQQKQSEEAQTYLAQASQVLSNSLDYQTTLTSIAQLSVPNLADYCAVYVTEEDGSIQRLATTYAHRDKEAQIEQIIQKYPVDRNDLYGVANVIRLGKSELYQDISDELLVAFARNKEHLQLLREVSFCSAAIVPMIARGKTLGAMAFFWAESMRHYTQHELFLAQELAQRAALAIDNAKIYQIAQCDRVRAEVANRIKDEFLATLSHELRTPLNSILGWTQMLAYRNLDKEMTAKALEIIDRNSKSLATLIEDLLDVSHIITGKVQLNLRPVNLRSTLEAAIAAVRPAAQAKGIQLNFSSQDLIAIIIGDYDRLKQVFWNILANAIKFTPNGGRVEVKCTRIDSRFQIETIDTGIGINPDFLPHVFERFRQADSSTTRFYGGLGLGLAIVRHFVELHGGTVKAESQGEGKGSKFVIDLPAIEEGRGQEAGGRRF